MSPEPLATSPDTPVPDNSPAGYYRERTQGNSSARRRMALMTGFGSGDASNESEDVDPSAGLVNLADLMLVFACGLMLALVAYWNIDLEPTITEVDPQEDMTEVANIEDIEEFLQNNSAGYSEVGKVFRDPETGQLYMLTEDMSIAGGDQTTIDPNSE